MTVSIPQGTTASARNFLCLFRLHLTEQICKILVTLWQQRFSWHSFLSGLHRNLTFRLKVVLFPLWKHKYPVERWVKTKQGLTNISQVQIGHLVRDEPCPILTSNTAKSQNTVSVPSCTHKYHHSYTRLIRVARLPYIKYSHVFSVKYLKILSQRKIKHLSAQAHWGCFCPVRRQRGKTCFWLLSSFPVLELPAFPTSPTTITTKQGSFNFPNTD